MKQRLIIIFILMSITATATAAAGKYGLRFMSHEVPAKERTTLDLLDGEPVDLGKTLTLKFHMDVRNSPVYGCILHIRFNNGKTAALLFTPQDDNTTFNPALMIDDKFYAIDYKLSNPNPMSDIPVSIAITPRENRITVAFDGKERTITSDLKQCVSASVSFGNQRPKGGSADVAPIDIYDVEIERDRKPLYFWELKNHQDSITTDKLQGKQATAVNGYWLQDDHTTWKTAFSHHDMNDTQHTYNHLTHTLYIINDDSLVAWNAATGKCSATAVKGHRAMTKSKYFYSNDRTGMLYSYNLEKKLIAQMNPDEATWTNGTEETDDAMYYNHAVASHGGDTLFVFGGYGFYRFHNGLYMLNTATNEIKQLKLHSPAPEPRVAAGMAWVGDKLYLFGGYGNKSGKQEMTGRFFYDFWEIDLATLKAKKLWETEKSKDNFMVASQLIYDSSEQAFYAATTQKYIIKFNTKQPGWQVVTNKIPIIFEYNVLNYSLYRDDTLGRIIAVTDCYVTDKGSSVNVFTIDLPLMQEAISADSTPAPGATQRKWWIWAVTALLIIIAVGAAAVAMRRRKAARDGKMPFTPEEDIIQPSQPIVPAAEKYYERGVSEIRMLGEFAVSDKQGNDITTKFSQRSRDLLTVLLLSSVLKEKGIENNLLDEVLWEDKNRDAARNNRNVYMRKIRILLQDIGNIDIISDKVNYKANIGSDVLFDFGEANRLMDAIENGEAGEELTDRVLELLQRGPLLPMQPLVWLDDVKSNYSNRAICLLKSLAIRATRQGDDTQLYHIAEAIMAHDPFNEEALALQCHILCKRRTTGLAKHLYNKFCKTYRQSMGEPYEKSFSEVCKGL